MTLNDVAAVSVSDECAEKRTLGGSEDTPPPEEAEALPWTEGWSCTDSHGIGRWVLVCVGQERRFKLCVSASSVPSASGARLQSDW